MNTVSILGLGAMGSRMAQNLLAAGHTVTVYNRSDGPAEALVESGATRAPTPQAAAAASEVVVSMVTDDEASRAVWTGELGAARGLREGAIAIESSTLTPAWVKELDGVIQSARASFLDAPVVGTRPQADAGALIYLVGGPPEALHRVRPLLDVMGGSVVHVGPVSQGMTMKLVVNALFGIQIAAVGEMLGLIRTSGLDEQAAADILREMPVMSPAANGVMGLMTNRTFAPMFPIGLVEKDFRYVLQAAEDVGASVPTSDAVRAVYASAQAAGFGPENIAAVAKLFEDGA